MLNLHLANITVPAIECSCIRVDDTAAIYMYRNASHLEVLHLVLDRFAEIVSLLGYKECSCTVKYVGFTECQHFMKFSSFRRSRRSLDKTAVVFRVLRHNRAMLCNLLVICDMFSESCLTLSVPHLLGTINLLTMVWNIAFETLRTAHGHTVLSDVEEANLFLFSKPFAFYPRQWFLNALRSFCNRLSRKQTWLPAINALKRCFRGLLCCSRTLCAIRREGGELYSCFLSS